MASTEWEYDVYNIGGRCDTRSLPMTMGLNNGIYKG